MDNLKINFKDHNEPYSSQKLFEIMSDMRTQSYDVYANACIIKNENLEQNYYDEH